MIFLQVDANSFLSSQRQHWEGWAHSLQVRELWWSLCFSGWYQRGYFTQFSWQAPCYSLTLWLIWSLRQILHHGVLGWTWILIGPTHLSSYYGIYFFPLSGSVLRIFACWTLCWIGGFFLIVCFLELLFPFFDFICWVYGVDRKWTQLNLLVHGL